MVAFETGFFSAQVEDKQASGLTEDGATGGPIALSTVAPATPSANSFTIYDAWTAITGNSNKQRQMESIARGQVLFNTRTFSINNVGGFNDFPGIANPAPGSTCGTCHNQHNAGSDFLPMSQRGIGTSGDSVASNGPAPDPKLPIFKLACQNGATNPFTGNVVMTTDLDAALITGKCADIGMFTVPPLRSLASHAPYFHDGSAATLPDVVNFYDKRFSIGLSPTEKADIANFLSAL